MNIDDGDNAYSVLPEPRHITDIVELTQAIRSLEAAIERLIATLDVAINKTDALRPQYYTQRGWGPVEPVYPRVPPEDS